MNQMEYFYRSRNRYDSQRHYMNLLRAGYSYAQAGKKVQAEMDIVWRMVRDGSKPHELDLEDTKMVIIDEPNPFLLNT